MATVAPNSHREHLLASDDFVMQEKTRFAVAVTEWREKAGLSRREVAEKIGVSIQQIQAIEKERSSASFAVIVLLLRAMGRGSICA